MAMASYSKDEKSRTSDWKDGDMGFEYKNYLGNADAQIKIQTTTIYNLLDDHRKQEGSVEKINAIIHLFDLNKREIQPYDANDNDPLPDNLELTGKKYIEEVVLVVKHSKHYMGFIDSLYRLTPLPPALQIVKLG